MSEHSTILCRCPGTSARAPSVNMAYVTQSSHGKSRSVLYNGAIQVNLVVDGVSVRPWRAMHDCSTTVVELFRQDVAVLIPSQTVFPTHSSQLEPSYKIKTCTDRWVAKLYCQVQPARKKTIQFIWLRSRSHLTITKQLGKSWLELAEVAKRCKSWLELGENLSLITFKPTEAKWVAKRYPTPSKLWTWLKLAWVGRTVWPGL